MKAIVVEQFGSANVLNWTEWPDPVPAPRQIAIKVHATSVNMVDTHIRKGLVHDRLPYVPGLDAAGEVIAVGEGVARFKVGDRVVAFTDSGSHAEIAVASEALTYSLPEAADDAAVCGLVSLVAAWNILHVAGRVRARDAVLVNAAAGSVGSLAIQVARMAGAVPVVGLVSSRGKIAAALEAGADAAFTYEELAEAGRLAPKGFDVVLDGNAGPMMSANLDYLAPNGRLITFGEAAGSPGRIETSALIHGNRSVVGYSSAYYREHDPEFLRPAAEAVIAAVVKGSLRVKAEIRLPLAEAARAHDLIESRITSGKILLTP